ncbi:MAG TPA: type I restriction-modification enzyme R subunit C-terminal domain-containing protein, partial [Allocoleopsis sp.]
NGSIFFTIFQTFMSGDNSYFYEYEKDFFDIIIIDECHRGGANDESSWRSILEYFSPAVQLGLTATPKRKNNVDTYAYFGEPVYIYSLKEGINNGFLTPFRIKQIETSIDEYSYSPDDEVLEGEINPDKNYTELVVSEVELKDFNITIEIRERELKRVQILLSEIDLNQKTIVFCANQNHAALIRDLINQEINHPNPDYCVRVTANDGERGENYLRQFQQNDKNIPTILTTSKKLSTGLDARNLRNIVLLRPIKDLIEFKQIVGRGTRICENKTYFTIYDFVGAYQHFNDPEWDGEPIDKTQVKTDNSGREKEDQEKTIEQNLEKKTKVKIKLREGKEFEIEHSIKTYFYNSEGSPISAQEFLQKLYGTLPELFTNETELKKIWSSPITRKTLLDNLESAGFNRDNLQMLKELIGNCNGDLFDVLEFIAFNKKPITRRERVNLAQDKILPFLNHQQRQFIDFVLEKYIEIGEEELEISKLASLLELKYQTISDAKNILGDISSIRETFIEFQKYLYDVA